MKSIRIDKYLAQLDLVSRRDAKKFFREGRVSINDYIEYDHGFPVIDGDRIVIDDTVHFEVRQSVTLLLYKPAGYVCSEIDEWWHKSYKHLLADCIYAPLLKVAGRLDQDTTGLVLATSDGDLNHRLISPKSHKEKEYIVTCNNKVSDMDLSQLECWVIIDGDYQTLSARTVRIDFCSFHLIITEGKYHQIKKMCEAIDNEVIWLHRIRIDQRSLDNLWLWKWRYI